MSKLGIWQAISILMTRALVLSLGSSPLEELAWYVTLLSLSLSHFLLHTLSLLSPSLLFSLSSSPLSL